MRGFGIIGMCIFILGLSPGLQASNEPVVPTGSLGAQAAALGGAQVALPGSAEVLFANPAALCQVRWPEAGTGWGQEELGDLRDAYAAAALPLFGQVTGGAGLLQAVFPRGPQTETDAAYAALSFPLSRDNQLLAGVSAKYFFHDDTPYAGDFSDSRGAGVDLGFLYKLFSEPEGAALQLGLSVCDPQTILKNENFEIQLPVVVRAGAWGRWDQATSFSAEYDSQSASAPGYDSFQVVRLGCERRIDFAPLDYLALRLGYFRRWDQGGVATGGIGLAYGDWRADYALQMPLAGRNAFHELSFTWSPRRLARSQPAAAESEATVAKPKPAATPKPQDRIFSALDTAAEVEEQRRAEIIPTPTPVPKAKPKFRSTSDAEPADESAAVYRISVPQSPADQENLSVAPELDMPGSFSGYLSGLKTGKDNLKIVNQDARLLVVVNPFSPNNDGRQDKTVFVARVESERLRVAHWVINIIQGDRVFRTFKGGSRLPHNLEWDGTDEKGKVLPDGTYDVLLRIFDEGGLEAAGVTAPVVIRTALVPVKITAPATVTLTGDKQQDEPVMVSVPLIPHSSSWRFRLFDPNRRKVFEHSGSGQVPEKIYWPPRSGGRVASSGKYRAVLEYLDEVGLKGTAETEFKVGYAAFSVDLKAAPLLFKPGKNSGEGVTFTPDLQGDLKIRSWSIEIMEEKTDRSWRRLEGDGQLPASVFWDGQDASGQAVPVGKMFRAVLTVVSAVGTEEHAEAPMLQSDLGEYTGKQALAMNLTRIMFEPDSALLNAAAIKNLQEAATVLQQNKTDFILRVLGYCDLKEAKDIELSRLRAQTVADYLVKEEKISPEKLQVAGYGKDKPLSMDAAEAQQARNRRVEILLFAK